MKRKIHLMTYHAPCGDLTLGALDNRLCLCDWVSGRHGNANLAKLCKVLDASPVYMGSECADFAAGQLDEYFGGRRRLFEVPLLLVGTDFQKEVWHHLMDIPYGNNESYGALAKRMNRASSVRAVANANGANPISVFVPCHRVIGSDGSLTGYGGGLEVKRFLLRLEM